MNKSPSLSPPEKGFPHFSNLPSELRRMIWRECLPARRVVELDYPVRKAHVAADAATSPDDLTVLHWCRLQVTTNENGRWPLVSRVCHEARDVVLKAKCVDIAPYQPGLEKMACDWLNQPHGCWIRAGQDVAHLNWHPSGDYGDGSWVELPEIPNPVPWLAEVAKRYGAAEVSVDASAILPFGSYENLAWSWETQTAALKTIGHRGGKFLVSLQTVSIHASCAEASEVGEDLFGVLGDSPIALVDPVKDWAGIEKARRLWRTFSRTDAQTAEFFGQSSTLQERVREWSGKAARVWLWHRWHDEAHRDALPPLGEIFTPAPFEGDFASALGRSLGQHHPWVAEQLDRMPEFQPVVMFRLCPAECHLETQDPWEIDSERKMAAAARGRARGRGRAWRWMWYPPRIEKEPV